MAREEYQRQNSDPKLLEGNGLSWLRRHHEGREASFTDHSIGDVSESILNLFRRFRQLKSSESESDNKWSRGDAILSCVRECLILYPHRENHSISLNTQGLLEETAEELEEIGIRFSLGSDKLSSYSSELSEILIVLLFVRCNSRAAHAAHSIAQSCNLTVSLGAINKLQSYAEMNTADSNFLHLQKNLDLLREIFLRADGENRIPYTINREQRWIVSVLERDLDFGVYARSDLTMLAILCAHSTREETRTMADAALQERQYTRLGALELESLTRLLEAKSIERHPSILSVALDVSAEHRDWDRFCKVAEIARRPEELDKVFSELGPVARGWYVTFAHFHAETPSDTNVLCWMQLAQLVVNEPWLTWTEFRARVHHLNFNQQPGGVSIEEFLSALTVGELSQMIELGVPASNTCCLPGSITIDGPGHLYLELFDRIAEMEANAEILEVLTAALRLVGEQDCTDISEEVDVWRSPVRFALEAILWRHLDEKFHDDLITNWIAGQCSNENVNHFLNALTNLAALSMHGEDVIHTLTNSCGILMYGRYAAKNLLHQYRIITDEEYRRSLCAQPIPVLSGAFDHNGSMAQLNSDYYSCLDAYFMEASRRSGAIKVCRVYFLLFGPTKTAVTHTHGALGHLDYGEFRYFTKGQFQGFTKEDLSRKALMVALRRFLEDSADFVGDACCSGDPGGILEEFAIVLRGKKVRLFGCLGQNALWDLNVTNDGDKSRLSARFVSETSLPRIEDATRKIVS